MKGLKFWKKDKTKVEVTQDEKKELPKKIFPMPCSSIIVDDLEIYEHVLNWPIITEPAKSERIDVHYIFIEAGSLRGNNAFNKVLKTIIDGDTFIKFVIFDDEIREFRAIRKKQLQSDKQLVEELGRFLSSTSKSAVVDFSNAIMSIRTVMDAFNPGNEFYTEVEAKLVLQRLEKAKKAEISSEKKRIAPVLKEIRKRKILAENSGGNPFAMESLLYCRKICVEKPYFIVNNETITFVGTSEKITSNISLKGSEIPFGSNFIVNNADRIADIAKLGFRNITILDEDF